ncbi:unnamed protein product, partial [Linum tenue]
MYPLHNRLPSFLFLRFAVNSSESVSCGSGCGSKSESSIYMIFKSVKKKSSSSCL